jgi:hypothetical protein
MPDKILSGEIHRAVNAVRLRRLSQHVHTFGSKRHFRTAEEDLLLGTRPDDQVALLIGATVKAVAHRRSALHKPICPQQVQKNRPWTKEEDNMVRTLSIHQAAGHLHRTRAAIHGRRKVLGICQIIRRVWTRDQDALFNKCNDKEIAEKLGRTLSSVENRRTRLKIRVPKPGWRFFTSEEDALLGTASDAEIAKRIGRHPSSVQTRRLRLGLAIRHNRKRRPWTQEEEALLGTASDTEIAARLDRHVSTVCIRRQALGLPNPYWQRRCGRQRLLEGRNLQFQAGLSERNHWVVLASPLVLAFSAPSASPRKNPHYIPA